MGSEESVRSDSELGDGESAAPREGCVARWGCGTLVLLAMAATLVTGYVFHMRERAYLREGARLAGKDVPGIGEPAWLIKKQLGHPLSEDRESAIENGYHLRYGPVVYAIWDNSQRAVRVSLGGGADRYGVPDPPPSPRLYGISLGMSVEEAHAALTQAGFREEDREVPDSDERTHRHYSQDHVDITLDVRRSNGTVIYVSAGDNRVHTGYEIRR